MNTVSTSPAGGSAAPLTVHFLGNILTFRARFADTKENFTVIDVLTAPNAGPPPHTQTDQEAFLVLDGRYEIIVGDEVKHCGPGDFVHVAPGTMHSFRNIAETTSRLLLINFPGDLHEEFFVAIGDPMPSGSTVFPEMLPPDVPKIVATAARFGIDIPVPANA
ncbi:cupin domain-containing protein [Neorhizobium galegae]|jgi:quercetin dioxygenase-like cupin family protein|uniref:cupin domain-containing protein n=1 Tax=Neorhizobium galegae TaxID=399 RepID=UPI0021050E84|nr:cupin domain-containing protein [Neorhizobium galegae]MCQ1854720.1 cupin domain-containing protein [Neorhizobium galegae]